MVQWYNLTSVDATNPLTLAKSISDQFVGSQLFNLYLLLFWFISWRSMIMFNNNPKYDNMVASGATAIFSLFFFLLDLVPGWTLFLTWGMFAVTGAVAFFSK